MTSERWDSGHRPRRWLAPALLGLALADAALAQGKGPPPAPVVIAEARRQLIAPITWYPGTVISRNQARLAAEVEGRIEWAAEIGDRLVRGGEVARLDDVLLRQTLAENEAAVDRERARLTYLNAEVARLEKLVQQSTATRSRLDEAVAERGVTRSELRAASARVRLTAERIARTRIKAPFAGVVTERYLQAGEWAESGSAVVRLVNSEALEVQTWVPVAALAFVHEGSTLGLKAGPTRADGAVRAIVPVGDNRSRLYEVRLAISAQRWPVGQDVRVAVPTALEKEVVAIPRDALVLRRDATVVYRINAQDEAERIEVTTGIAQDELIEVTGIEHGDRVVIRGGERLRPGQTVKVLAGKVGS